MITSRLYSYYYDCSFPLIVCFSYLMQFKMNALECRTLAATYMHACMHESCACIVWLTVCGFCAGKEMCRIEQIFCLFHSS